MWTERKSRCFYRFQVKSRFDSEQNFSRPGVLNQADRQLSVYGALNKLGARSSAEVLHSYFFFGMSPLEMLGALTARLREVAVRGAAWVNLIGLMQRVEVGDPREGGDMLDFLWLNSSRPTAAAAAAGRFHPASCCSDVWVWR